MSTIFELVEKISLLQDRLNALNIERNELFVSLAALKDENVTESKGRFVGKIGDRVFLVLVDEHTIFEVEEIEKFVEFDRLSAEAK